MGITREETKYLVDHMLMLCKELSDYEYKLINGSNKQPSHLKIYNVSLAIKRVVGKWKLEFVGSEELAYKDVLLSEEATKKLIEEVYYLVKGRKKGQALDYVYNLLNSLLVQKEKQEVSKKDLLSQVRYLYYLEEVISTQWREMEIDQIPLVRLSLLKSKVESSSLNKLSIKELVGKENKRLIRVVFQDAAINSVVEGFLAKDMTLFISVYKDLIPKEIQETIVNHELKMLEYQITMLTFSESKNLEKGLELAKDRLVGMYAKYNRFVEDGYNLVYSSPSW